MSVSARDGRGATVARVFRCALGRPGLRRALLAYAAFAAAEYGWWIAMLVYAYRIGGTTTASLAAAGQLLPAMVLAPLTASLPDRFRPGRVLALGYVAQALPLAAAAAFAFADITIGAFMLLAVVNIAITVTRPAYNVLLPSLTRTPDELVAANVLGGWADAAGMLLSAALTGALLTVTSPAVVFLVFAALVGCAALLVWPTPGPPPLVDEEPRSAFGEAVSGITALKRYPQPRLLVLLLSAQFVLIGACDVLFVILAVDTLEIGEGWAGYFNAIFGAGAMIGAAAAAALVGRARIAPILALAAVASGLAFVGIGLHATLAVAVVGIAIGGMGRSVFDVAGRSLLQRCSPPHVLGRIFGSLEALYMGGLAVGSLIVPGIVELSGARVGLIACGAILPLAVALGGRRLRRIDAEADVPVVELALLRALPIFRALPGPALEGIARSLEPVHAPAGRVIVREGDPGDRYFAIAEGEVEVVRGGSSVDVMQRGDGFGEIALLHDVPRTATVLATSDTELYALAKEPFLLALTGHATSNDIAKEIARERSHQSATETREP